MLRLLPLLTLVACTPSPPKAVMPSPSPIAENTPQGSTPPIAPKRDAAIAAAVQGPSPEPVSAAGVAAAPMAPMDSPAAALGRRILSTAFVRIGPDGWLTLELHGGRMLVLRDVTMGRAQYCGVLESGKRHCGGYAEVAAARPGGARVADPSVSAVGPRATPTSLP